jgi:nitronate monooxygenase
MTDFLQRLGIRHPIIQAPMAGGPGTPRLAAAVSNAGALGSLAGGYLTPDGVAKEFDEARALTSKPLAINLFAGGYHTVLDRDPAPMLNVLGPVHAELQLPPPAMPAIGPDPFPSQLEVVLRVRPEVFSFTFGVPPADAMRELRAAGIVTIGTATTAAEGEMLESAGVDAIVAQGAEAGAHRGTFAGPFEDALVPTLEIVHQISQTTKTPVIASGGIMTGGDIAAALSAGAIAVQMGTAFLLCPEAGTSEAYKSALRDADGAQTVITRAYSGRAARGIRNRFIDLVTEEDWILPFPIQNSLTRSMRSAAAKAGKSEYLSLWAGTGVSRIRTMPAADLIHILMEELSDKQALSSPHE